MRVQHRSLVKTLRTDIPPSEQKKPFSYVSANLTIDGTDIGRVAIRKKGFVDHSTMIVPRLRSRLTSMKRKRCSLAWTRSR
ncbi:MAG: hypothetical protein CM1200mP29_12550 [Verrucomicrobiota bacterium]|nr:MAG: hypothetical protein CM1200mP29_12550 [Verrucomicrobiota bacterium]